MNSQTNLNEKLLPRPRACEWSDQAVQRSVLRRVTRQVDPGRVEQAQGYRILVTPEGVEMVAHDDAGLFYADQTLRQIEEVTGHTVPCGEINDWPDFKVRGYLLDISRDRVPSLSTLCAIIDRLAAWKINQLHLYVEHTIAYRGHEAVWRNSSALSFDELKVLERHCRDRHIDLVPCQNLFGHLHRWLMVDGYKDLAECPDGWDTPWGYRSQKPFSLNPGDPRSMKLVSDLVGQLAPRSDSALFNIGCDETMDIGQGKSRELCERQGRGVVYLDFLTKVCKQVRRYEKTPMFWGDVVLHHPELTERLPKDAILLNWGYEAGHPFMEQSRLFYEAGVRQYVCPGTSSWCSLIGRGENAIGNLRDAAEAGLAYGAEGYLITDWGDYGHWQPFLLSWPGIAYGAAVSWAFEANVEQTDPSDMLNAHLFRDPTNRFGQALWSVSNLYLDAGPRGQNGTWWFDFLRYKDKSFTGGHWNAVTRQDAERVLAGLVSAQELIDNARPSFDNPALLTRELNWSVGMTRWVCERVCEGAGLDSTTPAEWRSMAKPGAEAAFEDLVAEYKALWLKRCRPGGLVDSVAKLSSVTLAQEESSVII
jgi:hypothetical protein